MEKLSYDFVVVGGGLAGVCAALAAARQGVKTALVQDRPVLGGNSSSEVRVCPLGSAEYNAWTRETGIVGELMHEVVSRSHEPFSITNSIYDLTLDAAVKNEKNLDLYCNTVVYNVEVEPLGREQSPYQRRIVAVHGHELASERELIFYAKHFADCTGDATVGALAGAEFRYGREGRGEFNEPLAPLKPDSQTMGSTLYFYARKTERPIEFVPPPDAILYRTQAEIGAYRPLYKLAHSDDYLGYWWIEIGAPYHQINDMQKVRAELLKHLFGVWNYIKNYGPEKEAAQNYALEWVGAVPGKRESRRLAGDIILTEHDCHQDRQWPDRVAYAGWFIDVHIMGGILNKAEHPEPSSGDKNYKGWANVAPFSLPLRALYSRNVANLWMAGRNISVTHVALGPVRVMLTTAMQGQAVGTAAVYAIAHDLSPRQTAAPAKNHVAVIQQQLLKDDAHVMGIRNSDGRDLALSARAYAAGESPFKMDDLIPGEYIPLDNALAVVAPLTHDHVNNVDFYLKNTNAQSVELGMALQQLETIWQKEPGLVVRETSIKVPANSEGWVRAKLDARIIPGKPHRIILKAFPGVRWARTINLPAGVACEYLQVSPGGCEPQNRLLNRFQPHETELPAYEFWRQDTGRHRDGGALAVRIDPQPEPYQARNVNNGWGWPYGMPNLWISGVPMPQALELRFDKPRKFNVILVSFDTCLRKPYHCMPPFWKAGQCARDWALSVKLGGEWKVVYEEKGNYQRRRKAVFDAVTSDALRLTVFAVGGDAKNDPLGQKTPVGVYEIRVYNEENQ
ncbi:MAG: FAD-dependent oxidoreductase [Kiritimatiellae bacterium]|nr:FAD-dependent oxidoreductase [Kiritimatiellia bacterium]